jgi:hypothetical protein
MFLKYWNLKLGTFLSIDISPYSSHNKLNMKNAQRKWNQWWGWHVISLDVTSRCYRYHGDNCISPSIKTSRACNGIVGRQLQFRWNWRGSTCSCVSVGTIARMCLHVSSGLLSALFWKNSKVIFGKRVSFFVDLQMYKVSREKVQYVHSARRVPMFLTHF